MNGARDPVVAAWAALSRSANAAGCAAALIEGEDTPWWSATFSGCVVRLTIRVDREAGRWLADLPNIDLPMVDCFVADCHVERSGAGRVLVSMLILDAG